MSDQNNDKLDEQQHHHPLLRHLIDWTRQVGEQPPSRVAPGIAQAARKFHAELAALPTNSTIRSAIGAADDGLLRVAEAMAATGASATHVVELIRASVQSSTAASEYTRGREEGFDAGLLKAAQVVEGQRTHHPHRDNQRADAALTVAAQKVRACMGTPVSAIAPITQEKK